MGVPIPIQALVRYASNDGRLGFDTVIGNNHMSSRGPKLATRVADEMRRFAVLFIYLWILFGLFVLNERIVLGQRGIGFSSQGFALINALVLAKVMLIAEDLNLGRWLDRRPLIYPILHDSLLFTVLFIAFHIVEKVVIGLVAGETVSTSLPAIGGGGVAGLLCVAVISFFGLIPFFAFRSFTRALGADRMNALLFGTTPGERNEKSHS